ncbi:hydrogen gas-evolving membrane-bound hydrogenase subunit E [Allokutzneria albata]|uniref:Multicomponent Na+:H+ antiporter subunit A n=1 Tax=Allokutzneria albata TaxID=211114 RepID=A0A1G9UNG5_ALLAB|nr:hydrogen gas-evolving membrane-bound hydrogenase subunit E [Allokutzneria albata]SDM61387.1 multicomponent Na+:H+ antiporter subunit A [Allokutzneria albata]
MLILILAHFLVAALLPAVAARWGRIAFVLAALPPVAALGTALSWAPTVLNGAPPTETLSWAPSIGLDLTLRLDPLSLLMIILVSGVGALVFLYYAASTPPEGTGRNSALLTVFAGSMFGLVTADDVFSLYVFWEFTTVCSFLLVGGLGLTKAARRSATQALLVTGFGGLAMLLGLILLGTAAGTFRISAIVAYPPSGAVVEVAVVLILVGALTKSAQVPFHPWLPAAMVAPTPVSAYLHAAAMVKAGVYLVARFAPGFAELPAWWIPLVVLGSWTMVLGGVRALREHDLKKLLAFGTVSQLGFLIVLLGVGEHVAAVAGATMVLAHGLFKSALFLAVGVIDKRTGTRDIRELSGLAARWPVFTGAVVLAAASMAGVPPLLGFVGKEAAFEALRGQPFVLAVLVIGSALTVAYSLRFLVGAFGTKPGVSLVDSERPGAVLAGPVVIPALAGLVFAFAPGVVEPVIAGYASAYPSAESYELALWHGFSLPLLLSAVVLGSGYLIHRFATGRSGWLPEAVHAQTGYDRVVMALDGVARGVTGRLQVGSVPVYLGVILVVAVVVPGAGLLAGLAPLPRTHWFDSWLQVPLAVAVLVAAGLAVLARRRLTAVLVTGVIGYGIGALFLVDGAPDLALAQFLVESLTLVVFVFVLRRTPTRFSEERRPLSEGGWVKAVVACVAGTFVAVLAVLFSANRDGLPEASVEYIQRAKEDAGASNVVNAIIVDFRAFDTVGEIAVLAVAATGAASLILASHRARRKADR